MPTPIEPFQVLAKTIGWQTSTTSRAYQLPQWQCGQIRIFNATAGQPLYAYVAFGDESVVAKAWSGPPPADCDLIIGPDAAQIITLSGAQLTAIFAGKLWAAAVLYSGAGGVYFTPGAGLG
jgi:hypothetical protein